MLSQQAFNAFLKTLEEPPPYAIFILATTEKHKILPTILSRCQIFDFNRIRVEDMAQHLAEIADASEKATVFAQGFMKDRMDQLDSAKTEEYKADAIDFAHSDRSMFAKEFSSMQTLGTETMLGGLVAQEGFDVGKEVPTGPGVIQKTETAKAFLVGQNNILERLIATNIDFIAKKAAMDNINNANSTFDQAPLAQKDLDALHAVSFAQAQEISNSGSDQIAQK